MLYKFGGGHALQVVNIRAQLPFFAITRPIICLAMFKTNRILLLSQHLPVNIFVPNLGGREAKTVPLNYVERR